jgi:hypothetical protein
MQKCVIVEVALLMVEYRGTIFSLPEEIVFAGWPRHGPRFVCNGREKLSQSEIVHESVKKKRLKPVTTTKITIAKSV